MTIQDTLTNLQEIRTRSITLTPDEQAALDTAIKLVSCYDELRSVIKQCNDMINDTVKSSESHTSINKNDIKLQMIKYGFHAPDMTVTEFVEDYLPKG